MRHRPTVLRFLEKPKKVVVGNQNYFNVEFIDKDITIQPQGKVTTNIFIYCDDRTYGLLLKVTNGSHYDDLVRIKWKQNYKPLFRKMPNPSTQKT